MVKFEFDNTDIGEVAKEFHNSFGLTFGGMADATLTEYVDCFRSFLITMSFSADMVDEALGLKDNEI